MSNKKAVVKIGADVEEAKKGIDSISSQVDDPPKIAGRYTKYLLTYLSFSYYKLTF